MVLTHHIFHAFDVNTNNIIVIFHLHYQGLKSLFKTNRSYFNI